MFKKIEEGGFSRCAGVVCLAVFLVSSTFVHAAVPVAEDAVAADVAVVAQFDDIGASSFDNGLEIEAFTRDFYGSSSFFLSAASSEQQ